MLLIASIVLLFLNLLVIGNLNYLEAGLLWSNYKYYRLQESGYARRVAFCSESW